TLFQFNAHFANVIAAIFIATGQDVAQVVESSTGYTWVENRSGNLYISVTLPSLEVGTVGGGTRLPTQREALSIMGVDGGGDPPGSKARKFAEIVSAAVLAGELNLLSALSTRELGKAHMKLGRGIKL
ncbi:MAG: 3-hydroxy-3-methylglutaryl-CoA reductase, partial [Metallosphaera sp.]